MQTRDDYVRGDGAHFETYKTEWLRAAERLREQINEPAKEESCSLRTMKARLKNVDVENLRAISAGPLYKSLSKSSFF